MELESEADVQKFHAAFVKSLNATVGTFLDEKKMSAKVLLEEKRQRLADLKDRLRDATHAQAELARIHEREITQRERAIQTLEAELKSDERDVAKNMGSARKTASKRGAARNKGKK